MIYLNDKEKKMIIELICDKQTRMIVKDRTAYESEKYKRLETLKIKIKECTTEVVY